MITKDLRRFEMIGEDFERFEIIKEYYNIKCLTQWLSFKAYKQEAPCEEVGEEMEK